MLAISCYECIANVGDGNRKHVVSVTKAHEQLQWKWQESGGYGREKGELGFEGSKVVTILPLGDHRFRQNFKM